MRTISGFVMAIGLCLVVLFGDASARGFGGFRGGYGGFGGGDRERSFRAGEDYGARRAVYAGRGFYAGGWGMDESDATSDDGDNDDTDSDDGDQ